MIDNAKKLLSKTSNRMGDLFFTIETGQITTPDFQLKVHDLSEDVRKEIKSVIQIKGLLSEAKSSLLKFLKRSYG